MKIKLLSLVFLTLSLSLTACGVKVFKSSSSGKSVTEDITRPPEISVKADGAGTAQAIFQTSTKEGPASYDEWLKKNKKVPAEVTE